MPHLGGTDQEEFRRPLPTSLLFDSNAVPLRVLQRLSSRCARGPGAEQLGTVYPRQLVCDLESLALSIQLPHHRSCDAFLYISASEATSKSFSSVTQVRIDQQS